MPGYPSSYSVTVSDVMATIDAAIGNVAKKYVWLVNIATGVKYGPSAATDSSGNWSLAGVDQGIYETFYAGESPTGVVPTQWTTAGVKGYMVSIASNPPNGLDLVERSLNVTATGTGAIAAPGYVVAKFVDSGGRAFDPEAAPYNAKGDGQFVTDASMASGSGIVTSASGLFLPTDVGKLAAVQFAGASQITVPTTIASYQSATQVTLAATNASGAPITNGFFMWASDDTTALQACINAAQLVHGAMYLRFKPYGINGTLTISDAMVVVGSGSLELWGGMVVSGNQDTMPTIPPYFDGAVIWQFAVNADAIRITVAGRTVNLSQFGVMFASFYHNTGHGINVNPPVLSSWQNTGIVSAEWDSVKVFGHDGNHYGFVITNPLNSSFRTIHSYGGGGLWLRGNTNITNYGNCIFDDLYHNTFLLGTSHGLALDSNAAQAINLIEFNRWQGWVRNLPTAIPGTSPPAAGQYTVVNLGSLSKFIDFFNPDCEQTAGMSGPFLGAAPRRVFGGLGMDPRNTWLTGNFATDVPLAIAGFSGGTQSSALFEIQQRLDTTSKVFQIDAQGHIVSNMTGAPVSSTLGANVTSVTATGNDVIGTIAVVMSGALAANTKIATLTFNKTYGATAPRVRLTNETSGVGLAIVNPYILAQATGVSFDIACNQALAAGTYTFGYIAVGVA